MRVIFDFTAEKVKRSPQKTSVASAGLMTDFDPLVGNSHVFAVVVFQALRIFAHGQSLFRVRCW